MPDMLMILAAEAAHSGPAAIGLDSYQWVGLAMLVLIAIFIWQKVPGLITGGLDKRIADIREQLDEAKSLREEAEKLRDEYAAKIANAEKEAEAMMESARCESEAILEKAEADGEAMVARRQRMAEDKIAAAEREAVEDVRARAVEAATAASRSLIAQKHDSEADAKLADEVISSL